MTQRTRRKIDTVLKAKPLEGNDTSTKIGDCGYVGGNATLPAVMPKCFTSTRLCSTKPKLATDIGSL
jgi:hypothetical protein